MGGASWKGQRASWEGLGVGGNGEKIIIKRERKNRMFSVYGGAIGHRPLQGCCPKRDINKRYKQDRIHGKCYSDPRPKSTVSRRNDHKKSILSGEK